MTLKELIQRVHTRGVAVAHKIKVLVKQEHSLEAQNRKNRKELDEQEAKRKAIEHQAYKGLITMFDSVDLSQIPDWAPAVLGYVDGKYTTANEIQRKWPRAHHVLLSVGVSTKGANGVDIENGDFTPQSGVRAVKGMLVDKVHRPVLYANLSTMPLVKAAMVDYVVASEEIRLLVADYTGSPHIPEGYDGCQWTNKAMGRNLDQSLLVSDFFD
jgi:hypothetical protein